MGNTHLPNLRLSDLFGAGFAWENGVRDCVCPIGRSAKGFSIRKPRSAKNIEKMCTLRFTDTVG